MGISLQTGNSIGCWLLVCFVSLSTVTYRKKSDPILPFANLRWNVFCQCCRVLRQFWTSKARISHDESLLWGLKSCNQYSLEGTSLFGLLGMLCSQVFFFVFEQKKLTWNMEWAWKEHVPAAAVHLLRWANRALRSQILQGKCRMCPMVLLFVLFRFTGNLFFATVFWWLICIRIRGHYCDW